MTGTLNRLEPSPTRGRKPSPPVGHDPVSLLSIGADLLPRQSVAGRAGRGRRLVAVGVVLAAVVAVAGTWLWAGHARSGAESALAAAQDQQRSLQVQQRGFDDLVRTRSQAAALQTALGQVMASDAPWSTVLSDLSRVRGGVTFTAVTASVDAPTTAGATTTTPVTPGAFARLEVSGTAADKPTVAAFVESLSSIEGFADPFLSNVSSGTGSTTAGGDYSFTVTVALTGDLRSAAVSRWATTSGGGK